ncbi:hypothetical protein GGQ64_004994 [Rhizobium azooxidifex]|uniref:Uncharacterized protein n=1 Tax=Mycoplana azooxidifex TaxID=1636188 RepID=A0A7W6DC13_9HYPH|nr:hypothetical protein [Mycoplana azooxidifex]
MYGQELDYIHGPENVDNRGEKIARAEHAQCSARSRGSDRTTARDTMGTVPGVPSQNAKSRRGGRP